MTNQQLSDAVAAARLRNALNEREKGRQACMRGDECHESASHEYIEGYAEQYAIEQIMDARTG